MSINREAKKQLARLAKCFAPIPESVDDHLWALEKGFSGAEVKECGDLLMDGHPIDEHGRARTFFPNPAEIAQVYDEIRQRQRQPADYTGIPDPPNECPACHGTGFISRVDGEGIRRASVCSHRQVSA